MTAVERDGKVEFRFFRPQASQVNVAGDFNSWGEHDLDMKPDGEGWWVAVAKLPPGEYRFRYVADGRWFTDFAAYGVEASPMGWNGVLVVPGDPMAVATTAPKGEHSRTTKEKHG